MLEQLADSSIDRFALVSISSGQVVSRNLPRKRGPIDGRPVSIDFVELVISSFKSVAAALRERNLGFFWAALQGIVLLLMGQHLCSWLCHAILRVSWAVKRLENFQDVFPGIATAVDWQVRLLEIVLIDLIFLTLASVITNWLGLWVVEFLRWLDREVLFFDMVLVVFALFMALPRLIHANCELLRIVWVAQSQS